MIYVFYPSKIMGGAEYLMIRTANLLQKNGFSVGVIDFENGWVSNNIKNDKIYKRYFVGHKKIKLEDNDFLITTANYMYKLDSYFEKSNTRVLLWTVQPYNTVISIPEVLRKIPLFEKIKYEYLNYKEPAHRENLQSIIEKMGIVSMDGECDNVLFEKYKINYNNFIPVFIDDDSFRNTAIKKIKDNCVRIIWLGRIDLEFKIHILKKVLLDIDFFSKESKESFVFDIIGNGPGLEELKLFVEENLILKVNFLGEIESNDLLSVISQYDLGFAMGTSALDIAAKKVPTILLDFSYSEVLKYNYRWIFETDKYTLGRDINLLSEIDIDSMKSIKDIFIELNNDKNLISQKCFDYVYKTHSSKSALKKLNFHISSSKFTLNDVYKYRLTKPFWNNIHSLVFNFRR